ncbi:MAG: carboxypeptidase regulatory-like domain-containing protein, partial [Bacteroidales bacterium]
MEKQAQELQDLANHGVTQVVPLSPTGGRAVGDDCTTPIVVSGALPINFSDLNQTNCGRGNTYQDSDLGSYDGGEDIIYQLVLSETAKVTITMDPKGTTWSGIGLFSSCPDVLGNSIATVTGSAGTLKTIGQLTLEAGTYYIMVDTWPSPACIPDFDLTITALPLVPGDLCTMAIPYGNYNDPAISGSIVSGQSVWYSFTGVDFAYATVSLCNSDFDTKLEIWADCGDANYLYYNDDECDAQSLISDKPFNGGDTWYVKVSGFGTSTGNYEVAITGVSVGDIAGHVTNTGGLSIGGAEIYVEGILAATTDGSGNYSITDIPGGDREISCVKPGYNTAIVTLTVIGGIVNIQDFALTAPNLSVSPLRLDETMAPNEYLTDYIGMLNTGSGPVDWTAEVVYPVTKAATSAPVQSFDWSTAKRLDGKFPIESMMSGTPLNSRGVMDCPDGSAFSSAPVGSDAGNASDDVLGYQVFQSFTGVTGSISNVTFWAIFQSAPPATRDYKIEFYSAGSTPGALISSGTYNVTAVFTGVQAWAGVDIYMFTTDITPVAMTDGWVSIQAAGGSPTNYWLNTIPGVGTALQLDASTGSYTTLDDPMSVCLVAGGAGNWLTLDEYSGTVNGNGTSYNLAANFDASGTEVGDFYTADIVISTTPNVGTITIPCTMAIAGDPIEPVTDLVVQISQQITGTVQLTWTHNVQPNFLSYRVKRNGVPIGTPLTNSYTDVLPNYGNFCYTVQAVYPQGASVPGGPECIEWANPTLVLEDVPCYDEVWPDDFGGDSFTIKNTGTGTMSYSFPAYTTTHSRFSGIYQIEMIDSYGDGWNGGSVTVYVAGVAVLIDATIPGGAGPEYASFPVESGDEIYTTFVPGGYPTEMSYNILDTEGNVVYAVGPPAAAIPQGTLFAVVPVPSYIVDVAPASGFIQAGGSAVIQLTYSSMGFPVGTYLEDLELTTNDPAAPTTLIGNTMVVYEPASVFGHVTDCNTGLALAGVTVYAVGTDFTTETDGNGDYELRVDADTYDIYFTKLGMGGENELGVVCAVGAPVEINKELCEAPYPVHNVYADPNEADTECLVTWSLPMGPYEIAYDDGTADDFI